MRPVYWFLPYNLGSRSCRDLAKAVDGRLLKPEGSRYVPHNMDILINWGSSHRWPNIVDPRVLNTHTAVSVATSKLATFQALQVASIKVPDFTQSQTVAQAWQDEKFKVVGRDQDHGRGGAGITVYRLGDQIDNHNFYTKYFKKEREFRIHVYLNTVIFEQEKKRRTQTEGAPEADRYIRSHDRGWVFAFNHLAEKPVPDCVRTAGIQAVQALRLHFGAVDIGWNKDEGACVFEVNTAPGLEGETMAAYANAIQRTRPS